MRLLNVSDLRTGAGDKIQEFQDSYESNYRSIRRFVARLSNVPGEADDLTQETFARLWREIESGREVLNPRAWLYRVASNLVTSRLRTKLRAHHRQAEVEEAVYDKKCVSIDVERSAIYRQIVPRILKRLPEPMRRCLLLYHEGLTGPEIAEILGVKPSYVGTLVVRAHERFRRECEGLGNDYNVFR